MSTSPPPEPDPGADPELSNEQSHLALSCPAMSDLSKLKILKPGYYTGKEDNRTTEKLHAWYDEITFYLMVTNTTDDNIRISFTFLYTKEDAYTWIKSWMIALNPDETLGHIDQTLDELLPALTKQFILFTSI